MPDRSHVRSLFDRLCAAKGVDARTGPQTLEEYARVAGAAVEAFERVHGPEPLPSPKAARTPKGSPSSSPASSDAP